MYHKINKEDVNIILNLRNKEKVFTEKEIEDKVDDLHHLLSEIDKNIPSKEVPNSNMGLNKETRELIKKRRRLQNIIKKNKNNVGMKNKLKELNKNIKKGMKDEKEKNWQYIRERLQNKKNVKQSWKTIKNLLNDKEDKETNKEYLKNENDIKIYNKQDIANTFMEVQQRIFTPNESNIKREDYIRKQWYESNEFNKQTKRGPYDFYLGDNSAPTHYETNEQITEDEVRNSLKKLKNEKAPGIYGIKNKLLKTIIEEITPPLTELFNDCMNNSYFPKKLKIAKIIMIPKIKNTRKIKEHRPISLLPTIGKILEQLIANKINSWAEANNKFNNEQSGFRKQRSTVDHLFQFVQDHQTSKNKKRRMHAVFVDFEKAFDKINHVYIIKKLKDLNIPTDILNILHSYLKNRKGFINYEQFKSATFDINAGVPQGSCLSPILFCLFVSDIPKPTGNVKLSQFADDIVIWLVFRHIWNNELEKYVNSVIDWCNSWGLKANIEKTKHMNMGRSKKEVRIKGKKLKNVQEIKFLGLLIDHKLTLKNHIKDKINKTYHLIKFLNELKTNYKIPTNKNIALYKTLIRSKLEYGHIALLSTAKCHIKAMEIIQNKALRTILGKAQETPIRNLYEEARITSVQQRLEELAKNWYNKSLTIPHHPIVLNQQTYEYDPLTDKQETLYNKLINF